MLLVILISQHSQALSLSLSPHADLLEFVSVLFWMCRRLYTTLCRSSSQPPVDIHRSLTMLLSSVGKSGVELTPLGCSETLFQTHSSELLFEFKIPTFLFHHLAEYQAAPRHSLIFLICTHSKQVVLK